MFLLLNKFAQTIHIKFEFSYLYKTVLRQTSNSFNTKFLPKSKYFKSSFYVRQILGIFCHLLPLTLGENTVKFIRATKNVKAIMIKGV